MDFSDILIGLWNKISKPIPNILLGLVILFLSPLDWETRWVGWIFIALAVAGILEYVGTFIKERYKQRKENRNLIKKLAELRPYELDFLKVLLSHNQRTFDRYDVIILLDHPQQNNISEEQIFDEEFMKILFDSPKSIIYRLDDLSIVSQSMGRSGLRASSLFINNHSYQIYGWYWDILKKQHKDIFNKGELYFRDFE